MDNVETILENYYNNYDEESRLVRDKTHTIEFITTTKFVDKYLKTGDRILEIGAGTGRYTIHYANKGYTVDAVELVKKNLDILKSKITKDLNVNAIQGNCLDLSMYEDNTFDVTLVLGPLYHLYTEEDAKKAIDESLRVTKKNGKIIIAYITDDAVVLSYGIRKGNLKRLPEFCDENWKVENRAEEIFATYRIEDFDRLISGFNVQRLETIAADGIAPQMQEYINNLDEEEFALYVDYHLKNCMRKELMGYSSHVLEIIEKR
ncbi:MAG: class I SAM-dependent methyltransferase [Clostridia bacterium]|nr:class I SAM-dependent methyltransferase [Clostridia bacterium]